MTASFGSDSLEQVKTQLELRKAKYCNIIQTFTASLTEWVQPNCFKLIRSFCEVIHCILCDK